MLKAKRELTIEWGHCDPAGIVFYPRYFEFFDASTANLFKVAGLDKFELRKHYDILGFPMVNTDADFKIPSRYGETVRIETRVCKVGKTSFSIEHRLLKSDGQLAILCHEKRVWVTQSGDRIRPKAIPAEVVSLLTGANNERTDQGSGGI